MLKPIFSSYSNQQFFTRLKKKLITVSNIVPHEIFHLEGILVDKGFSLKVQRNQIKNVQDTKKKQKKTNKQTEREREREGEINGTYSIFSDKS